MTSTSFDRTLPVAIGCDHAGFEYKEKIAALLKIGPIRVALPRTTNHCVLDCSRSNDVLATPRPAPPRPGPM